MVLNDSEYARLPWWSLSLSDSDEVNGSNSSAPMNKPKRTKSGTMIWASSFQVTVKADLLHCTSTQAKIRLLSEHLSKLTAHAKKYSFTSVSTFCDESLLSWQTIARVLFQLLSTDKYIPKTLLQFPQCRTLSILSPGNQSQEAWQEMQSSVPTVLRLPSCMCWEILV